MGTSLDCQAANTIPAIITHFADLCPDASALLASGREPLSYASLLIQLQRTVAALSSAGVRSGDVVAVVLPNGPEMAAAALAIASYTTCAPLNPAYGEDEFRFYLEDLSATALLLPENHSGPARTVAQALGIACYEACWTNVSAAGCFDLKGIPVVQSSPLPTRSAEDVAIVLHTSGTTSRPKIVPLSHRNLCRSAKNVRQALHLSSQDRCLNVMPLFHIHGLVAAVLASLSAGAAVACTPGFRDGQFVQWLKELAPSWYTAAPTLHQAILAEVARHQDDFPKGQLRFVRSSSAALPAQTMRDLEAALGAPVIEAYGMTEAAHQIASNSLPPGIRKPGSVGIAAGPSVAIMDEAGKLLGPDAVGEIVIRGDNVTAGYQRNAEANERSFTDGWFRTGDQGYFDSAGYLFLTGRTKEIINRGGEKVMPREIDEALLAHPAVRQAVAFAVKHPTLGEDVAAAVVLKPGSMVSEPELRDFVLARLAVWKTPSRVLILEAIPAGPTGKIQRMRLAAQLSDALQSEQVPPNGEDEVSVAAIFAEVLGVERVWASDDFFSLGGDSLRAAQVLARIRARIGADLSFLTLFRKPTIKDLAQEVAQARTASETAALDTALREIEALSDDEVKRMLALESAAGINQE